MLPPIPEGVLQGVVVCSEFCTSVLVVWVYRGCADVCAPQIHIGSEEYLGFLGVVCIYVSVLSQAATQSVRMLWWVYCIACRAVPIPIFQPIQIPKIYLLPIPIHLVADTFDTDTFIIIL